MTEPKSKPKPNSKPTQGPKGPNQITHPHDALVRGIFSLPEYATELLGAVLPTDFTAAVDWTTLRVEKDSFVDEALRSRYSDLVLSAGTEEARTFFYAIVEHQSAVEPRMVFRMLLYMVRLWERVARETPLGKTLPPIVPILIHQSDTGWTAATRFQDIISFDGEAGASLERHTPHFEMRLIDLSVGRALELRYEAISAAVKVAFWVLSVAGDDERLQREIGRMKKLFHEIDQDAVLRMLVRYLAATHPRMPGAQLGKLLMKAVGPRGQEVIVTFLEEIERKGELKGERKGERKGVRKGRMETLLELLEARFGGVPEDAKARIAAVDDAKLSELTLRVLTEPTLERVLHDVPPAPPRKNTPSPSPAPRTKSPGAPRAPRRAAAR